jgi:DNA replicative helicase MCM subunit Mcm2 (Cdc46/Mcm family)
MKQIANLFYDIEEYQITINIYRKIKEQEKTDGDCYIKMAKIYDEKLDQKNEALKILKEGLDTVLDDGTHQEIELLIQKIEKEQLDLFLGVSDNKENVSDNVVNELINHYLKMRENGGKNTISATPRQLESLIRLSEARARLRFSQYVEKEDVEEAVNLIKVATQQAATDPVTGVIDMDMLQTGITSSSRAKLSQLIDIIKTILRDYQENARKGVKFNSLGDEVKKRVNELGQQTFNYSDFDYRDALRKLEDENIVAILGSKNSPTIRLIARDF